MKHTKPSVILYVVLFTTMYLSVSGYPMTNTQENLVHKDEKRYPNGTVIGKYTYTDNEGNPIYVKYYADDASYGVELKNVKVMNSHLDTGTNNPLQVSEHYFEPVLDPFTGIKDLTILNKNLTNDPLQLYKEKTRGDFKNTEEFEVLLQNELKAPKKCGKEKVKVYFDKDKRKTRNAANSYDSIDYCNRF